MLRSRSCLALFLASAWMASPAAAREHVAGPPAEDAFLASLVEEAWSRNPDLRAARQEAAAARTRPDQVRALPDPMVSLAYTNDGWSPTLGERDMANLAVIWSQDLPFPGKRRLRGEIAERDADRAELRAERARLAVTASVKRAYYGLLLARALLGLIDEQAEVWKQIEGVARARYTVGQGAQQDVVRTQVEVTRIGRLQAEQEAEAEVRLAELNRLLDRAAGTPLDPPDVLLLRPLSEDPSVAVERLRSISPELKSAGIARDREGLAVALARKDFKPDLTLQAGYMNRGGLDPMWQASVGVRLPLARKARNGTLAEARARLGAAEQRSAAVHLQLRYRTEQRLAEIRAAERIAVLYENGIIPQDQMSVEAAVASYQTGKLPFVAVLEALGTLYGDRSSYLRLVAGHARARASLEEASLEPTADLPTMDTAAAGGAGAPMGAGMGNGTTAGGSRSMEGR